MIIGLRKFASTPCSARSTPRSHRGKRSRSPATRSGPTRSITLICSEDFQELHGDRQFNDDRALIGGTAFFQGEAFFGDRMRLQRDLLSEGAADYVASLLTGCPYHRGA